MRWLFALILFFSLSAQAAEEVIQAKAETAAAETAPATEGATAVAASTEATTPALKPVDTRKESEIPLNLEAKSKSSSESSPIFRIIMTLAILGVVGTGAVIFLRKYSVPKAMKTQTQIKILQQHYLGPKKSLAIVRVAGESILIGITEHNISMIKSLSLLDDEVPEEAPPNFGRVLGDIEEDETPVAPSRKGARELDADEEFAISGIKDIVSKRLKGMRSFQ